MKYLIIFISVFCLAQYSSAEPLLGELLGGVVGEVVGVVHKVLGAATKMVGKAIEIVTPAAKICGERYTLTSDELFSYNNLQVYTTRNGNCFHACLFKELEMMSSNNKAMKNGFIVAAYVLYPHATSKQEIADELFALCGDITDPDDDECEAAAKILACVLKAKPTARKISEGELGEGFIDVLHPLTD